MSELLFEICSMEIPARMQEGACIQLENLLRRGILELFPRSSLTTEVWATPQRLGICVKGLDMAQFSAHTEMRGPRVEAPQPAHEGFLRKNNLKAEQLFVRDGYYYANIMLGGGDAKNALRGTIAQVLKEFVWPKSMIDGANDLRWVRPVKSIACLVDGEVLEFQYHHITSSNKTSGHKFMSPEPITVKNFDDYRKKLANAHVMLDASARIHDIKRQVDAILSPLSVRMIEDKALIHEVAGLVENPQVFLARIPDEFMALPREVLIMTLRHNQKYLMTEDAEGQLAPYYLIVSNIEPVDKGAALIEGNQRVLCARLWDAKFFYEQDIRVPLQAYVEGLKTLIFNSKLGSVYDKQQSVGELALKIARTYGTDEAKVGRAVDLAKCDLVSSMVKEFPELQGVMGYYYATHQGEDIEIARAIYEHYKPQGPSDSVPTGRVAAVVALADKLDTLNQMFAIGIKPTGSKDPFALRRAALGILRIAEHHHLELLYAEWGILPDVQEFIQERKG